MRWLCFKTNAREEFLAEAFLLSKGFRVLMPFYKKTVRHARSNKQVLSPIFPTYGFLLYDGNVSSLYKIKYARGVKNYLHKFDGLPHFVPNEIIKSIESLKLLDGSYMLNPYRFKSDESVRIISGAIAGITAIFKEQVDKHRSKLLVNLLGRINIVKVNTKMVEHA